MAAPIVHVLTKYKGNHKPPRINNVIHRLPHTNYLILDGRDCDTATRLTMMPNRSQSTSKEDRNITIVECNRETHDIQKKKMENISNVTLVNDLVGNHIQKLSPVEIAENIILDYCSSFPGNDYMSPKKDLARILFKRKPHGHIVLSVCRRSGRKGYNTAALQLDLATTIETLASILKMEIQVLEENLYQSTTNRKYGSPMAQFVIAYKVIADMDKADVNTAFTKYFL